MLYLAYGSNLHQLRIKQRVPSAVPAGTTIINGWHLRFHKRSVDGSGKASIVHTQNHDDRAFAAVYQIHPAHRALLDREEFLGKGYNLAALSLPHHGEVFFYVADADFINDQLKPYRWYLNYVIAGARHHRCPPDYIRALQSQPSIHDPDQTRRTTHEKILQTFHAPDPTPGIR